MFGKFVFEKCELLLFIIFSDKMTQVSVDNIYQEIGGERQIVGQVRCSVCN